MASAHACTAQAAAASVIVALVAQPAHQPCRQDRPRSACRAEEIGRDAALGRRNQDVDLALKFPTGRG